MLTYVFDSATILVSQNKNYCSLGIKRDIGNMKSVQIYIVFEHSRDFVELEQILLGRLRQRFPCKRRRESLCRRVSEGRLQVAFIAKFCTIVSCF